MSTISPSDRARIISSTWWLRLIPIRSSFGLSSFPVRDGPAEFHPTDSPRDPAELEHDGITGHADLQGRDLLLDLGAEVVVVRDQQVSVGGRRRRGDQIRGATAGAARGTPRYASASASCSVLVRRPGSSSQEVSTMCRICARPASPIWMPTSRWVPATRTRSIWTGSMNGVSLQEVRATNSSA